MKKLPPIKIEKTTISGDSIETKEETAVIKKIETTGKIRGTIISHGKTQILTEKDINLIEEV